MDEASLFNTVSAQANGEQPIGNTVAQAGTLCDYFRGKPLDRNSACARPGCGRPWSEHYPEYKPQRMRGVVAEVCSICAYPLTSDQHVNHCR